MSLEGLNAACVARRDRLRRERRVSAFAFLATAAVFAFILFAAFGGLK